MHKTMNTGSALTVAALLEAIGMIRAEMKPAAVFGDQSAQFYEVEIPPDAGMLEDAQGAATELLHSGIGVKVSVQWQYSGSRQWSVKTADAKVINRGA